MQSSLFPHRIFIRNDPHPGKSGGGILRAFWKTPEYLHGITGFFVKCRVPRI